MVFSILIGHMEKKCTSIEYLKNTINNIGLMDIYGTYGEYSICIRKLV